MIYSSRYKIRTVLSKTMSVALLMGLLSVSVDSEEIRHEYRLSLDSTILNHLQLAQTAIFNERWSQADSVIFELRQRESSVAHALLLSAARIQAEMFSREEPDRADEMKAQLDSAQVQFERGLIDATASDSAQLLYFIGNCHTHRALWEAKFGSFITAIKRGLKAKSCYQLGLEADSEFTDLHSGLGAYRYWKSAKGGVLRWTGLISDERVSGIEELREATQQAFLAPDAAKSALIWILINEKEYQEAGKLALELREKYPGGATFLWPLAESYRRQHKYRLALDTYLEIREKLLPRPGNQINLIKVDYEILALARVLEDSQTVKLVAEGFDEYSKHTPRKTRRKLSHQYRSLRRL